MERDLSRCAVFPPVCRRILALSLFGVTGLTAYFGVLDVGRVKAETHSSFQQRPVRPAPSQVKSPG